MKAILKQQEATALAKSMLTAMETGIPICLELEDGQQYITPVTATGRPYRMTVFLGDVPITEGQRDEAKQHKS